MIYLRYALALHPEVQEELYQSITHEVKGDVTYDHLKKLKLHGMSGKRGNYCCEARLSAYLKSNK